MDTPKVGTKEWRKFISKSFLKDVLEDLKPSPFGKVLGLKDSPLAYFQKYLQARRESASPLTTDPVAVHFAVALALHGDVSSLLELVPLMKQRPPLRALQSVCCLLPSSGQTL